MANHRIEFDRTLKYGYLLWVRDVPDYRDKKGGKIPASVWKCDCGKEIVRQNSLVVSGNTSSCGCQKIKHNMSSHPLYMVWENMKRRCYNRRHKSYKDYGGRGITVCDEWLDNKAFFSWALSHGYKAGLTIDRIDVNGNYCPENCRWVDLHTQANNKRDNRPITINGITKNAKEWADSAGLKWTTFQRRIDVYGMSPEEALVRQVRHVDRKFAGGVEIDGVVKTVAEWSRISGVHAGRIAARLRLGWEVKDAVYTPSQELGSWSKKSISPGTKIGCITVLEAADPMVSPNGKIRSRYRCVCDCGREKLILQQNLIGKNPTTSCGRHECRRKAKELAVHEHQR